MLDSLLTHTKLRALAGYGYERGVRYWEEGRVRSRDVRGDGIVGVVAGSTEYTVRVFVHAHTLFTECTCPVGSGGMMCKHGVALALDHLDHGAPREPAMKVSGPAFETRAELDAWVQQHQVAHELQVSAAVLVRELAPFYPDPHLNVLLDRLSLRDIGSIESVSRLLGVRQLQRPAAEAVARRLERAATEITVALDEEKRPRVVPAEPMAALWTRLVELRAKLRERAVPRPRSVWSAGTLDLEVKTSSLTWVEPTRIVETGSWTSCGVRSSLWVTPKIDTLCTCRQQNCTHIIGMIDAALELLADPTQELLARKITEELLRPAWQRALAEIDRHEAKPSKKPEIEVWWQVEHEFRSYTLTPFIKKRLKKGGLSAGSRISPTRLLEEFGELLTDQDSRIAENICGWVPTRGTSYASRAFVALVGHPRVVFSDTLDEPLVVKRVKLGFAALAAGDEIKLEPSVEGSRFSPRLLAPLLQTHAANEPMLVVEPEHGRCLLIDVSDEARHLWSVLEKHGDAFPPESHAQLLDRLARLESRLPLDVPHALKGTRINEELTTIVRLHLMPDGALELEAFVRPAAGAPLFPPGVGPKDVMVQRDGGRGYVRRDLDSEHVRVRTALGRLPLEGAHEAPPLCFRIEDTDAALALVAAVQQPPPGLAAEWIDGRPTIVSSGGPSSLRVQVEKKRDWFGIDGDLKLENGRLELAVLLDAARRQQRYVRLDERRWIELSDALRQRLTALADQTFATRNQLELSPGAVPAIQALVEAGARVDIAPSWQLLTDRLAASVTLRPRPPGSLTATLRPYQIEGHAWMSRLAAWGAGGCLADDMGLGKTVQALAVLLDRSRLGPALVLAPTSVTLNWIDELRRFAPSLRPVLYAGATDRAACLAKLTKKDVLIASYGLLARDAAQLAGRSFATLVIDEAQALKNPATRRAKAARMLVADFRIALTGTPLENHLGELWSLFSIVFPNLLGSWEQFRQRYGLPIERDKNPEARAALSRVIRPFLLRRTKHEVARELPSRTEIQVPVALSNEETALYEDARLAAVAHLTRAAKGPRDERRRFEVLAALTRLRLLASHPRLYDATSPVASSKMQRLLELLEELRSEGHRALVFSQFTSHLALVRTELDKVGISALYLDGSTPTLMRAQLIERFQRGEGDVFLISLKAGGTGINLTAADYVIHLDPWWNPAVEDQATDRAHRIGQTRPVTVYRLISRGTVEERILAMHGDKRALVSGILDGTDVAARLTTRDLLALLSQGETSADARA